ncbi:MAG: methyltransferase domain-containing protein [Candidatus Sungbacteria bacterium]|uniref:Methyltransferase domain-containing protein n=1 Tax=Candidatus Sungiibacteriota bacterium TaxID=2750080 RepID=A0A932YXP3_9BACT|nr:methyltransferase domain-containing protein [Candidatus Sungbacteria bacterium]
MTETAPEVNAAPAASPAAESFLHPERMMNRFDIRPGMIVADFGTGSGHFALAAARRVGERGKVYAIDIQKNVLSLIKSKAALEHLLQVEPIWADLELPQGSRLHEGSVDFVIISNILFQVTSKPAVLAEARRILKKGGTMAVLEWDATPFPAGPPQNLRMPKADVRRLAETLGFHTAGEFDAGSHHYGLLFTRP